MSVRRNTAYNVAGAVVPLLATLVTLPVYLRTIGDERYGVLIVLWTLLGYFGLFDLGLGRAVTHRIASFRDRTSREREEVFWTALLLNVALGLVGALALWGAGLVGLRLIADTSTALILEAEASLPWMVLAFPLLLASGVMSGALMGRESFLSQNVVGIVTGVLIQVVPLLVALLLSPTLPALVLAVLAVRVFSVVTLFWLCVIQLPLGLSPRPTSSHVRPLFGYGGWVTVTSIVSPILTALDRIIIGVVAGAAAVTYYTVPFSLASRISVLPGSLASALFPRFSSHTDGDERMGLMVKATSVLGVLLAPLFVVALLGAEPLLTLWMGAAFAARSSTVAEVLLLGVAANSMAYLPFGYLQGVGRPDLVARFHVLEAVPYLLLLWLGLERFGIVGAAAAWTARVVADAVLLFRASSGLRGWRPLRGPAGFVMSTSLLVWALPALHPARLAMGAVLVASISWWSWRHTPSDLKTVVSRLARGRTPTYTPDRAPNL